MIVGLGIDVCSVARMQGIIDRWGDRFIRRVLTPGERESLAGRADRAAAVAGRYAAKEATAKALAGAPGVGWHHVEVQGGSKRAPQLVLTGPARVLADRMGVGSAHVSITHDAGVAAAVVILESDTIGGQRS